MVLVEYQVLTEKRAIIQRILFDQKAFPATLGENEVIVDNLPIMDPMRGEGIYFINPQTDEVWMEYREDKTQELETALLEISTLSAIEKAQTEQAIMELTMMIGGM